ncbi:MAG: ammonium transporter [Clostridia bacterium]|nr:ammonium transporter [Clostridia bacterium]
MFVSTALVFLMTPGLALFYGGMVRKKNVLNTMMNSFIIIALISIQWVLFGYTLSFGPDKGGLIGGLDWMGFRGVGGTPNADYAGTIPHSAFAMFQLMFAIITPALITGAFAERMRFPAFLAFTLLWSTLVYDPLAHWVWGVGGWLRNLGALDFAGGTVVHISSGIAGLVAAIVIGKRKGYKVTPMIPHNIPFVLIGAGLLWFGWFGFNPGSALASNGLAFSAFVATNTSAAAAVLSWVIIEWMHHGKPTLLGAATGGVVGLVAITPAAGYVDPLCSIIIGLLVSPICYFAVSVAKSKLGYDDSLDAFGCHGIGGIWGALATGLFASKSVNPAGADGLFFGNASLLGVQALSVIVTIVLSAVASFIILKVISIFTKLRVDAKDEDEGLDIAQHGEDAYPDFATEEGISL